MAVEFLANTGVPKQEDKWEEKTSTGIRETRGRHKGWRRQRRRRGYYPIERKGKGWENFHLRHQTRGEVGQGSHEHLPKPDIHACFLCCEWWMMNCITLEIMKTSMSIMLYFFLPTFYLEGAISLINKLMFSTMSVKSCIQRTRSMVQRMNISCMSETKARNPDCRCSDNLWATGCLCFEWKIEDGRKSSALRSCCMHCKWTAGNESQGPLRL